MSIPEETTVGKKGEILPKKRFRMISTIKPGDKVLIEATYGELNIRKVFSIDEIFEMPIISKQSAQSVEKELEEEGKLQEELAE